MKTYCQKCGAKVEFSVKSKPKFCHGCGTSLSLGSSKTSTLTEEVDPQEEAVDSVPSISELEVDIMSYEIPKQSLGDVVGTDRGGSVKPSPFNNQEKEMSKEEFRKQFQKEAGTLRTSDSPRPPDEK